MVIIKSNYQKITNTTVGKISGLIITLVSIPVAIFLFIYFEFFNGTMSIALKIATLITQLFLIGYYTQSTECLFRPAINKFYISKRIFWYAYKNYEFLLNDFHAIKTAKARMMHHSGFMYTFYIVSILGSTDSYELGTVDTMDELEKLKELSSILRLKYVDH